MPDVMLTDDARRLDLQQQKKRAKDLRRDLAAGVPEALERFRGFHPKAIGLSDTEVVGRLAKISEAQLVIARELGLASWPNLKHHIERWVAARRAIDAGAAPVDREMPTTHVRCGSDIQEGLERAGIVGQFLVFSDPYCQGPVPADVDLLDARARFIAGHYGMAFDAARARLGTELERLHETVAQRRVVLWFEHDSYDQLILARILAFYEEYGAPGVLDLVCIDAFPAVDRFNGLGQLSPVALRMLWDDRRSVSGELLALGTRTWDALRRPDPLALRDVVDTSGALPPMARAVRRHLQELPWTNDGLSLTQRLTLQMLAGGATTAGKLFRRLSLEIEPLVFLGDTMYWVVLEELLGARTPAVEVDDGPRGDQWRERHVTLTDVGHQLLNAEADWMECDPAERWVGGVRVQSGRVAWRWNAESEQPVRV